MSKRRARKNWNRWMRYFAHYEPWHYATPGLERAYNALVHADYARIRRELRAEQEHPWADPDYPHVVRDIQEIAE